LSVIIFVTIAGTIGAWLLVAGPMYQAAIELQEQAVDQEIFDQAESTVPPPPKISNWWWLLPPVAFAKQRKGQAEYRQAIMDVLGPEQMRQAITFLNKATGWILVAVGAFLLAVAESWNLTVEFGWAWWSFIIIVLVALAGCIFHTVARIRGTSAMMKKAEADSVSRGLTPPGTTGRRGG
jgi:hypothetical protein